MTMKTIDKRMGAVLDGVTVCRFACEELAGEGGDLPQLLWSAGMKVVREALEDVALTDDGLDVYALVDPVAMEARMVDVCESRKPVRVKGGGAQHRRAQQLGRLTGLVVGRVQDAVDREVRFREFSEQDEFDAQEIADGVLAGTDAVPRPGSYQRDKQPAFWDRVEELLRDRLSHPQAALVQEAA